MLMLMQVRIRIGIRRIPSQVLHMLENKNIFLLLVIAVPVYNVLSFSSVSNVPEFQFFKQNISFKLFYLLGLDNVVDWHALDADTDLG